MTDTILAMIPDYGLYLIFFCVVLACLAAPLPASVLVLAAGSFAAAEDLVLWQVLVVAFSAFAIGDQLAYRIARGLGPRLLNRFRGNEKMAKLIDKSETLLETKGTTAVLASHTILSPTCPYVSYLCGMGGMKWAPFTVAALIGAAIWTAGYVGLGYVFANQLSQVSTVLSNFFGFVVAGAVVVFSGLWLRRQWRKHHAIAA